MRIVMVAVAGLALAGCDFTELDTRRAREICTGNGNALGSASFNRCFETTFASLSSAGRSSGPVYIPPPVQLPGAAFAPAALAPCPRPVGFGQVGQAGQRGQGSNCL